MKYILESLKRTKAGGMLGTLIACLIAMMIGDLAELKVLAKVLDTGELGWFHIYLGVVVLSGIAGVFQGWFDQYRMIMFNYLHIKLMDKVLHADYKFFEKYSPASIIKSVGDTSNIVNMIKMVMGMIQDAINAVIIIIFISMIDARIILPILFVLGVMSFLIIKIVKVWVKLDEESDELKTKDHNLSDEVINGFVEVRSYSKAAEDHLQELIQNRNTLYGYTQKKKRLSMIMNGNINFWCSLISIGILIYIMHIKSLGMITTSATTMTLVMYVWKLMQPIINISCQISDVSELLPKIKKYAELIDYKNEVIDGKIELESFDDSIKIQDVSFGYDKSSTVLHKVSMDIKKGMKIGICGASGCGKSTLLKLLNRFYDPTSGSIMIDGIDIHRLTHESRRKFVGTIHQSPYIFNGTILENIMYGIDKSVTMAQVEEACKMAAIYDFIVDQKDGFETIVGPRGLKLSGGQKQRISIARLFLMNPEIILLDEATSALDNDTEAAIQDAMKVFKNKTIISVAHRLSTIQDSDIIYVFAEHSIAESGTHDELMKLNGLYAQMHR